MNYPSCMTSAAGAHSRAFLGSGLVNLWKSLVLHLIRGERKKIQVLLFKTSRAQKCEMDEIAVSHLFIGHPRTNSPNPSKGSTGLLHHHGSEGNARYAKGFGEKKAVLGEMWRCRFIFQTQVGRHCHIRFYYKNNFNRIFWEEFVLLSAARGAAQSHTHTEIIWGRGDA